MQIDAETINDYMISVLDDDKKLSALKNFFHVCRKNKNCDCLAKAIRIEHCALIDAQVARSKANPVFSERFGC